MAFEQFKVEQPVGINLAREPSQLNPNLWDGAENIGFRFGITKKVGGYEQGFSDVGLTKPEIIVPLRDDEQHYYWWAYAGDTDVKTWDGILPSGTPVPTDPIYQDRIIRITAKNDEDDVTPIRNPEVDPSNPTGAPDGWNNSIIADNMPGGAYTDFWWTGDSLNGVPYMTKGIPYRWEENPDAGLPRFYPLTKIPRQANTYDADGKLETLGKPRVWFKTIRTHRNFMIGLNFSTDGYDGQYLPADPTKPETLQGMWGAWEAGDHQNAVWWSDGAVDKDTDVTWEDANPAKQSGWNFLGGAGGPILDGKSMRDSFMIYRERSVWQMTYIGGVNIFAFKEVFSDAGILGLDCVAEVEGKHFVVGQSDIYMHNGVSKQSIADGIVRKQIYRSIDPQHIRKVFLATKYDDKEVWICIPEVGTNKEGACNLAYVYNWEERTWSKKRLPDVLCSTYTILSIPDDDIGWDAEQEGGPLVCDGEACKPYPVGATWAEATDSWLDSQYKYNPSKWGLAMGSSTAQWKQVDGLDTDVLDEVTRDHSIYTSIEENTIETDRIYKTANPLEPYSKWPQPGVDIVGFKPTENFVSWVEKKWMDMGDKMTTKHVTKVYPLIRSGKVKVYMGGTYGADDGISWKYIGEFDSTQRNHIACRVTGRYIHIHFEIPEESRAEIRGFWLDYEQQQGRR